MSALDKHQNRIGYLILAHRYPDQLFRMVDRLQSENVTFLIHIDKNADEKTYQVIRNQFGAREDIHFIKRFRCNWAGFGIIQATLQGIKEAIERDLAIDHLVLLSGQDYPIKEKAYIDQFLLAHRHISFLHHNAFPFSEWVSENGGWDRVKQWYFIRKNSIHIYPGKDFFGHGRIRRLNTIWNRVYRFLPTLERTFPLGLQPYGGAQFWCLAKKHYTYVNQFVQEHPEYVNFFRYVFVPDEILIQTIVGNATFRDEVRSDTLHFLEWHRPGAVLNISDKDNIRSTYHLFARKFDTTEDAGILDYIDKEILKREQSSEL